MNESQLQWYKNENLRLTQQVEQLVRDNHRLSASNKDLQNQIARLCKLLDGSAVGERADACVAIDGGNLCERLL